MPFSDPFVRHHGIRATKTNAFQDPLERPEWRGLDWLAPLLARLTRARTPEKLEPARRPRRPDVMVQTRSPFLTR
jgi:hypothetical protein